MGGAKNCPETPRQKMIGMMYLVLTAMLALNVSTDILNGFTLVDKSLHSSIAASDTRNAKLYNDFKAANADNPEKTQEWFDKAIEVQKRADSLFNYIQDFKEHIAILADGNTAMRSAYLYIQVRISNAVANLFKRTAGCEHCKGRHESLEAKACKTGRD